MERFTPREVDTNDDIMFLYDILYDVCHVYFLSFLVFVSSGRLVQGWISAANERCSCASRKMSKRHHE